MKKTKTDKPASRDAAFAELDKEHRQKRRLINSRKSFLRKCNCLLNRLGVTQ
jgi:hypothetical protein